MPRSPEIRTTPPPKGYVPGDPGPLAGGLGVGRGAVFFGAADGGGGASPAFEQPTGYQSGTYPTAATLRTGDPADLLPAPAGAKIRQWRADQADIRAALRELSNEKSDCIGRRQAAAARLRGLERVPADHPARLAAQAEYDRLGEEIGAIDARLKRLEARLPAILGRVEQWLRELPTNIVISEAPAVPLPKLARGQTVVDAIAATRAKITELRAEIGDVRSAPVPSCTVKARLREEVDALVARGRPKVEDLLRPGGSFSWPVTQDRLIVAGPVAEGGLGARAPAIGFTTVTAVDTMAIGAWLDADRLYERLAAEVDAAADDAHALDDDERRDREASLLGAIAQLERQEEAQIEAAEAAGQAVTRRPGADPLAVLAIVIIEAQPAPDRRGEESSPQWSTYRRELERQGGGGRITAPVSVP